MDAKRIAELIVEADDASKNKQIVEPIKAEEGRELIAQACAKYGPEETAYTIANIINKRITDEAQVADLSGILLPYDQMYPLNEGPMFERESSPILYWIGDESNHLTLHRSKPVQERFTMTFDSIYYYFEFNVDLLRDGVVGNMQSQINKARNQMVGAANMLMWYSIQDTITNAAGANIGSGTLTYTALKAAVNWVEDESQQGPAAILGRRSTLTGLNVLTSTGGGGASRETGFFSDSLKDQAWRNYLLDVFVGVPILGIRQQKINVSRNKQIGAGFSGIDAIPKSIILVRPKDDFGFFAEQGPIEVMQTTSAKDRTLAYSGGRRMGAVIFDNARPCYKFTVS
jgi:hypothetical protein